MESFGNSALLEPQGVPQQAPGIEGSSNHSLNGLTPLNETVETPNGETETAANMDTDEALMCARSWLRSAENSGNMSSKISNEYATLLDEIEPEDEGEILTSGVASLFEDGD
ncbi:hypothetical protein P8452_08799 [Trifolium repens]|nr:hypothetical protein P8452_08799 [Trifolium repens]